MSYWHKYSHRIQTPVLIILLQRKVTTPISRSFFFLIKNQYCQLEPLIPDSGHIYTFFEIRYVLMIKIFSIGTQLETVVQIQVISMTELGQLLVGTLLKCLTITFKVKNKFIILPKILSFLLNLKSLLSIKRIINLKTVR